MIRIALAALGLAAASHAGVQTLRLPEGAIQPQIATATDGTAHIVFYKGEAGAGNLFYARGTNFTKAIQVNSQNGSAIAAGTIRGAQIALGKNDRLHVIWNGGNGAKKVAVGGKEITPLLYTRLNDGGDAFEPERNLITSAGVLDGGSSVAADDEGNVMAVWHGAIPDKPQTEANRAVFIARSANDGKTFAPETIAKGTEGVCACCGLRAFTAKSGASFILYRAARSMDDRPVVLLGAKGGEEFRPIHSHPWKINMCPMSFASFAALQDGALAAWETSSQVHYRFIDGTLSGGRMVTPLGTGKRKHPVVCANNKRQVLLAWTEDTSWAKGGSIAWQIFSPEGAPAGEVSRAEGLPAWSFPAAFAQPNGDFTIVY